MQGNFLVYRAWLLYHVTANEINRLEIAHHHHWRSLEVEYDCPLRGTFRWCVPSDGCPCVASFTVGETGARTTTTRSLTETDPGAAARTPLQLGVPPFFHLLSRCGAPPVSHPPSSPCSTVEVFFLGHAWVRDLPLDPPTTGDPAKSVALDGLALRIIGTRMHLHHHKVVTLGDKPTIVVYCFAISSFIWA